MDEKVILVPGFMGSALTPPDATRKSDAVWFNRSALLLGGAKKLALAADGVTPLASAGGVPLVPSADYVDPGPWHAVTSTLQAAGMEPVYWPYDWRLDIRMTAQRLAEFLAEQSVTGPFYILAHSMGGLIARLAYAAYLNLASGTRWLRTLYVATPQYGTDEAAQYLARPVQTLSMLGLYAPGLVGYLPGFLNDAILGALNGKVRGIVATWPAIYQCLPDVSADWIATRPLDRLLYRSGTYQLTNTAVSQPWLDAALATRAQLNATVTALRPPERNVLGVGFVTPDKLQNPVDLGGDAGWITADGDGTVTPPRGGLPGMVDALTLTPGQHCDLMSDSRLLAALPALIRDGEATPAHAIVVEEPPAAAATVPPPVTIIPPKGLGEQQRDDP